MPVPESEVRDLLAAISDALDPPWPAGGGYEKRRRLVSERAAYINGVLRPFVSGRAEFGGDAQIIREYATRPLPYEPKGGQS